ncbi:MAG: alcohol dehydrogenase (quinone), cytochrome c subunit [Caballeronia sp.]|jgi:mono/diheme cytochrome c family protein|nr:alcohol dehydrogenase (quinone), cytochrome c subunit [Caballeronia sp.]MEA3114948.1 alcohol dehydrogenase (quinone), cytochrome c subunit [Caballeronia sp.]
MKKAVKKLAAALTIGALAQATSTAALADDATQQLIKRGEYLARAGDCVACHTATGGKPFAGGLPIQSPIGTIYSTNLTPDAATGIGTYTYDDFERAVRHGVSKQGYTLYPAMPYPSYARVHDDDMHALYAYFVHGIAPVSQLNRAEGIKWPMSMRWPLTVWRWAFAPKVAAAAPMPGTDPMITRGAYLVEGLAHCSACHTPRGTGMQELALTAQQGPAFLSGGGPIDSWIATNLRGDATTGLGQWSATDLSTFLKSGSTERIAAFGGMTDVVQHSTQYMTDEDRTAIAMYLKSLPGTKSEAPPTYDAAVSTALHSGNLTRPGADTYLNSCAACHRSDGKGYASVFPALALNPVVNGGDATSLIHIVLAGSSTPATQAAPAQFTMPPYGWRLSDTEVANVLTLLRSSWGNHAAPVTAAQVAKVRATLPVASLGAAPQR